MTMNVDGFVCLDAARRSFGFIVFRTSSRGPVEFVCSHWGWPASEEGRNMARQQLVRVIDRERLAEVYPGVRALDPHVQARVV